MGAQYYTDLFTAKDRVVRILRDSGPQPFSRLLMNSELPEEVLNQVLDLLQKEKKVRPSERSSQLGESVFQPVSGAWFLGT
jgi:hypothetical protein